MRIGELGQRVGLSAKTVRYYEGIGILWPAARTASGYRSYSEDAVARLKFVRKAKDLGLTLADIRDILTVRDRGESPCPYVLELLDRKIAELERRISGLRALRYSLLAARQVAAAIPLEAVPTSCVCHIIEQHRLSSPSPASASH